MSLSADTYLRGCAARFKRELPAVLSRCNTAGTARPADLELLETAARYSLGAGGKRIRPTLCYAAAESVNGGAAGPAIDVVAASLELVHTYSLVHDDLPAMDDDDLRRGKPSLHKAYDEATAILVGDGLQAHAFQLLATAAGLTAEQRIRMVEVLAQAVGPEGMVGGQFIDIRATDTAMDLEALQTMHNLKTGALIRASLALGGIAAGARDGQLSALDDYGQHIGLAFQVVDDILDVEGDTATLGKTQGKDSDANKPTYVKLMGLEGARDEANRLLDSALDALQEFGESADPLRALARYIVERDR